MCPFGQGGRKGFSLAQNKRIGFIGAGRVAGALATTLAEAGYNVIAVASRTPESAQALASGLPDCRAVRPQEVVDTADTIFITTPDGAVREVCDALTWRKNKAAVHTSGALSRQVLTSAARQGAATGSLHPLQTFADHAQARMNIPGSVFAVEAEGDLREELLAIVGTLKGTAIELDAEKKRLYHTSAVLVSNYTVTLMKMASDLWQCFGQERDGAVRALLPLLKGAVNNLDALGVPLALTGPIARGDVDVVRGHLEALRVSAPELIPAYTALALQTIPIARERGGLDEAEAAELTDLLRHADLAKNRNGHFERTRV
jgi:predicted short-subunit dehydrogenase-like oxidoreductase (DUF2520 family)